MTTRTLIGMPVQLCSDAASATGAAPEWIQLFPAGPRLLARDGRSWAFDADAVVAAFEAPVPVDYEHASEIKPLVGDPAPAVGWVEALAARDGAVWGRVAWLAEGAEKVASRAYRFCSPAFLRHPVTGAVTRLRSVGLTNTPALRLPALAREDHAMELTRLEKSLGLAEGASPEEMEARAAELAARPEAAAVDMARFAPRADLDQALARAAAAEGRLADLAREQADAEIAAAVDAAVKDGKIAPVSRDFYVDACRADGGLEKFRAMVAKAPALIARVDPAAPPAPASDRLTAEDVAVCSALGIERAEFARLKTEEAR